MFSMHPQLLRIDTHIFDEADCGYAASAIQTDSPGGVGNLFRLSESVNDGQQWWCQQHSPEWNHDTKNDGNQYRRPDRHPRRLLHQHGLNQELLDDDNDGIEAQQIPEANLIVSAEKY